MLSGTLRFVGLSRLLGLLAESRLEGQLSIAHDSQGATVSLKNGHVVGAELGAETGLIALDAIALLSPAASFTFTEGLLRPAAFNLNLEPARLIPRLQELEAASCRFAAVIPSPWSVLVRSEQIANGDLLSLERGALALWLNCDGRTMFDLAGDDGLLPTVKWTLQLAELGLLECKQEEVASPVTADANQTTLSEPSPAPTAPLAEAEAPAPEAGPSGAWARWRRPSELTPKLGT